MSPSGQQPNSRPVFASACLLGLCTRYDGRHCLRQDVMQMARTHSLVPVCPEQLGGLPTPRPPAEISSGSGDDVLDGRSRLLDSQGVDVTEQYLRGASHVAQLGALLGVRRAIFKEGSPACGVTRIRRLGKDVEGRGVTTALLLRKGIQVEGVE